MTKWFVTTCFLLFLAISGCSTVEKQQLTLPDTAQVEACPLVPCLMPGRLPPKSNEDWTAAIDDLERELKSCSLQVLRCISIQSVGKEGEIVTPLNIIQPTK